MAGGSLVGDTPGLLELEQEEKMLLRRHVGKASLWVCTSKPHHTDQPALPLGSSGAPILLLCNTEIKQLLVSSSMGYNKYCNFVPNILGLSSNYLTLYTFFNLSEVKFLQLQIWAMAVERG